LVDPLVSITEVSVVGPMPGTMVVVDRLPIEIDATYDTEPQLREHALIIAPGWDGFAEAMRLALDGGTRQRVRSADHQGRLEAPAEVRAAESMRSDNPRFHLTAVGAAVESSFDRLL
jgi:hypothetical protein